MAEKNQISEETLDLWKDTLHYYYSGLSDKSIVEEFNKEQHTEESLRARIEKIKENKSDHDRFRTAMSFKSSMRIKYQ